MVNVCQRFHPLMVCPWIAGRLFVAFVSLLLYRALRRESSMAIRPQIDTRSVVFLYGKTNNNANRMRSPMRRLSLVFIKRRRPWEYESTAWHRKRSSWMRLRHYLCLSKKWGGEVGGLFKLSLKFRTTVTKFSSNTMWEKYNTTRSWKC